MTTGRPGPLTGLAEDAPDDDTTDDILEADDVGTREREALAAEEKVDIERLLMRAGDWSPIQWYDSGLATATHDIIQATGMKRAVDLYAFGSGRSIRDEFERSRVLLNILNPFFALFEFQQTRFPLGFVIYAQK